MAVSEKRVTRGRLLKRAGIGAAALGAGSLVTAGTAGAAFPPSKECTTVGGCGVCSDPAQVTCGSGCGCVVTVEGCCHCHQGISCGNPHAIACTKSSQCPPGWACARTCCNGFEPICVPHCGFVAPTKAGANTSHPA